MSNLKPPVVAIIGSTGYVGKCLMPAFLESHKSKQIQLKVVTSQGKLSGELIQSYVASGAKAVPVPNYKDVAALTEVLKGVDVVVSALSIEGDGTQKIRDALLDAIAAANVKVYFPSEFGTNYYKVSYNHPAFEGKKNHLIAAKKKGIRTIRIVCADIMEAIFRKEVGLDCKSRIWTVVGNGADIPCAMTSERDLARFTLEAILLAHKNSSKCPDELEVYSDMRTLREYAKAFDKVSGGKITINSVPLDEFVVEYNKKNDLPNLLMLMFAVGVYDYSKSTANNLLNPNESRWKLKKIEEYARETNGIPWKDLE